VTYGVTRDQMMARHKANHINVAYATDAKQADNCLYAKAELAKQMGMEVYICGTNIEGKKL
ncbi:MAG: fucose isomerase, partial [Verrucomicrobia bacterium]|nr:fucose isomerase [Verrucomicrobiota bacterium]